MILFTVGMGAVMVQVSCVKYTEKK